METLPIELIINILVMSDLSDFDKFKILIGEKKYELIINKLIEYIILKNVTINNNHVLIEINPRRKMSIITKDNNEIKNRTLNVDFDLINYTLIEFCKHENNTVNEFKLSQGRK